MNLKSSALKQILHSEYQKVFEETWPLQVGGVLIGLLSIITFTLDRPWGVVGGIRAWGDWFFYTIGFYESAPASILTSSSSLLTLGLLWGALAAALLSKQVAIRIPPTLELIKGGVGGVLLGIGATLAGGCNVGGFYSAVGALSLSGIAMLVGLLLGAYVGLKYLYWELAHLTQSNRAGRTLFGSNGVDGRSRLQPALGLGLLLGGYLVKEVYSLNGYVVLGGLLLCGIAFGFVLHRSRFCFARCFREPFMTGDPAATQAVILSLMICVAGFAVIKWSGLRSEWASTPAAFGLGGFAGGLIFGFGMLLAGGCGSGSVWRAAEGQVKLILALVFYALSSSLMKTLLRSNQSWHDLMGHRFFLPDVMGYPLSVAALFTILMAWYLVVVWNEKTEKFVIPV
jgi:uncharacterized protein